MCRRAMSGSGGKKHFACFACRKCFKQPGSAGRRSASADRPFPCPECGRHMTDMGADFKAPRMRDRRQWLKVEVLHGFGVTFRPGCCDGPGERPAEFREVGEFLAGLGHPAEAVRVRTVLVRRLRSGL